MLQKIKEMFSEFKNRIVERFHLLFKASSENQSGSRFRKTSIVLGAVVAIAIVGYFILPYIKNASIARGGNFIFKQTGWATGDGTIANYPGNNNDFTNYTSKTANIEISGGGADNALTMAVPMVESSTGSVANYTGYDSTANPGFYLDAVTGNLTLKKLQGATCTDTAQCKEGNCLTNVCVLPCDANTASGEYCSFGGLLYGVVTGADGKLWMDRNLGATAVASGPDTEAAYGWLFQWGRKADGHQFTAWGGQPNPARSLTAAGPSATSTVTPPNDVRFLTHFADPYTWLSPQVDTLWSGVSAVNNPCPTGFRVPTQPEWAAVMNPDGTENDITNYTNAASNLLHFPAAGYRHVYGNVIAQGTNSIYWSSTPVSVSAYNADFNGGNPGSILWRGTGLSVRCIKD